MTPPVRPVRPVRLVRLYPPSEPFPSPLRTVSIPRPGASGMPRHLFSLSLLILGIAPSLFAQTSHSDRASVRRGIDAGNAAYIAAFKRGDANALSEVYDPQGSRLSDSGVVVLARKAISEDVGKFIDQVGPARRP